ncbi:hypothetical protein [Archangium lansingense]|uniref:Tail assembly chaperone n=1 Tax=Archangium lansingense TaxID=2995310 RepID=A0ABT4AF61_9BACT|nr:hypothetical protein [Archangium lansinium]MCY1080300.1 hypothetical protein [Archangium lansinium]
MHNDDLNGPPRIYKEVTVTIGDKAVPLVLRRASKSLVAMAFAEAKKAGDVDANNNHAGEDGAMRALARMASLVVYRPGAVRPAFNRHSQEDLERIIESEWLMELQEDINGALAPAGVALERMKGNSEATPTEA